MCLFVAAKVLLNLAAPKSRRGISMFVNDEPKTPRRQTHVRSAPKLAAKTVLSPTQAQDIPQTPSSAESKQPVQGSRAVIF